MITELLAEGVPERRGGGSGIWSLSGKCPFGEVRAGHLKLSGGDFTELSITSYELGAFAFPRIFLNGHVKCQATDLFNMYISEFYKLGTPELFVSILKSVANQARKEGADEAQSRIRIALGLEEG